MYDYVNNHNNNHNNKYRNKINNKNQLKLIHLRLKYLQKYYKKIAYNVSESKQISAVFFLISYFEILYIHLFILLMFE